MPRLLETTASNDLGKTKPYKDAYRSRLDRLADTGGDESVVIDETLTAFTLNGHVLEDLTREPAPKEVVA
ncbi:biliverdin-producing heme oxygenase [Brevibacterium aurantiacum]|uniref:Biliverdin-producing heme oxygenase n=1 Tax=Brevibacterium aurantiacum TaxID=273384 RepID=A0A556CAM2_BREAU|nr:biliverdin-producing heme oxygenase [Brevibacterium aurantiacum]TSI14487.1 biliverdin-producing heme oxygenase [Brevibacterium aurantiacum]